MGASFLTHFVRTCMPVAAEHIKADFKFDDQEMGWLYSAFLFGYTLCMLPGGWLSDRWGGRLGILFFAIGSALFCALTALAGFMAATVAAVPLLLAVRFCLGVANSPIYPAAGRIVAHWIPLERRAFANALVTGSAPVGDAATWIVFGTMMDHVGWKMGFIAIAVAATVLAIAWNRMAREWPAQHPGVNHVELEIIGKAGSEPAFANGVMHAADMDSPPQDGPRQDGAWRDVFRNPGVWLLFAAYATVGWFEYLLFYWAATYFTNVLEFSAYQSRIATMVLPLTMAVGMPLGGWLADHLLGVLGIRWARAGVAMAGMLAAAGLLWLGTTLSTPSAVVAAFALAMGCMGICEGASWATAVDLGGPHAATSGGLINTGGNLGGTIMQIVSPWIATTWNWNAAIRFGCVLCVCGAVLWMWIDAGRRCGQEVRG